MNSIDTRLQEMSESLFCKLFIREDLRRAYSATKFKLSNADTEEHGFPSNETTTQKNANTIRIQPTRFSFGK